MSISFCKYFIKQKRNFTACFASARRLFTRLLSAPPRTTRCSKLHRSFSLRSCPLGFKSLHSYSRKLKPGYSKAS